MLLSLNHFELSFSIVVLPKKVNRLNSTTCRTSVQRSRNLLISRRRRPRRWAAPSTCRHRPGPTETPNTADHGYSEGRSPHTSSNTVHNLATAGRPPYTHTSDTMVETYMVWSYSHPSRQGSCCTCGRFTSEGSNPASEKLVMASSLYLEHLLKVNSPLCSSKGTLLLIHSVVRLACAGMRQRWEGVSPINTMDSAAKPLGMNVKHRKKNTDCWNGPHSPRNLTASSYGGISLLPRCYRTHTLYRKERWLYKGEWRNPNAENVAPRSCASKTFSL